MLNTQVWSWVRQGLQVLMGPWDPQGRKVIQVLWEHKGPRAKRVEVGNQGQWVCQDQ